MKAEDIVESLNRHIEYKRKASDTKSTGHLVLQRIIKPNPMFKVYKSYEMILWYVNGKSKTKVLSISDNIRMLEGQEESVNKYMAIKLTTQLFNWIGTIEYEQIINGEL